MVEMGKESWCEEFCPPHQRFATEPYPRKPRRGIPVPLLSATLSLMMTYIRNIALSTGSSVDTENPPPTTTTGRPHLEIFGRNLQMPKGIALNFPSEESIFDANTFRPRKIPVLVAGACIFLPAEIVSAYGKVCSAESLKVAYALQGKPRIRRRTRIPGPTSNM